MRALLFAGCALLSLAGEASAQIVANDGFSYAGALSSNGWVAHSGAGSKVVTANGAFTVLDQSGGSGEDVSLTFPAFGATDTIYASFRLVVPSGNLVNPDGQGLYFAHFKDSGTLFRGRMGVLSPAGSGDYRVAINADNADLGLGAIVADDLLFDHTYRVVIFWNAATGASQLWVDPLDSSSPSVSHTAASTGTLIEGFALRQSNDYTGFIHVNDVVVGASFDDVLPPAPAVPFGSGLALGALAGLILLGTVVIGARRERMAV